MNKETKKSKKDHATNKPKKDTAKKAKTKKLDEKEQSVEEKKIEEVKEDNQEEIPSCETDIEQLEATIAELKDKHLRLFSEFENYRRRTMKERIELFKTASSEIIIELLGILDDFDRANKSFETATDIEAVKQGFELIHSKLQGLLAKKGLESMDALEKDFDTDFHEAITEIPAPTKELKSKVVDVIEKGYLLNGKVIRFAKVVVGK
ncbi:MAG: nucleotide exchange factor GrpE [Bacteroidales bacterium]|nr:nucleotide exchange factor GrpE [Bacteroidales bacterium]RLD38467.1 MAG: nucleotide exchange factor GrpE [Bacteroidota bacterium]